MVSPESAATAPEFGVGPFFPPCFRAAIKFRLTSENRTLLVVEYFASPGGLFNVEVDEPWQ